MQPRPLALAFGQHGQTKRRSQEVCAFLASLQRGFGGGPISHLDTNWWRFINTLFRLIALRVADFVSGRLILEVLSLAYMHEQSSHGRNRKSVASNGLGLVWSPFDSKCSKTWSQLRLSQSPQITRRLSLYRKKVVIWTFLSIKSTP